LLRCFDLLHDIEYWIEKDADGSDRGQIYGEMSFGGNEENRVVSSSGDEPGAYQLEIKSVRA